MKLIKLLFLFGFIIFIFFSIVINYAIENRVNRISKEMTKKEFAIVLGAAVHKDTLSDALKARMIVAISLYQQGLVKKILLSGDGTNEYYSETSAMKKFALKHNIPQDYLLTDEKGINTYSTMLRAHDVFHAQSAYIITQNFHLARSIWVALECGIDAQGASAGHIKDPWYYYIREFFARVKDYLQVKLKI